MSVLKTLLGAKMMSARRKLSEDELRIRGLLLLPFAILWKMCLIFVGFSIMRESPIIGIIPRFSLERKIKLLKC